MEVQAPKDEPTRIRQILRQTEGNVVQAARLLGLSRKALRYRMQRYGIERLSGEKKIQPSTDEAEEHSLLPFSRSGLSEIAPDRLDDDHVVPTQGEPQALMPGWEQKPVVVLAIEVTWQETMVLEALRYEPWTVTTYWEQAIAEKVQGFGGVVLRHAPSLRLVAFGLPQTLEQLPQRAVQAALAVRHLVTEAHAGAEGGPYPAVRQVLHWGQLLVDVQAHNLSVLSHRGVRRWAKNPRQAHLQAP